MSKTGGEKKYVQNFDKNAYQKTAISQTKIMV
jgi:hypothetical protein